MISADDPPNRDFIESTVNLYSLPCPKTPLDQLPALAASPQEAYASARPPAQTAHLQIQLPTSETTMIPRFRPWNSTRSQLSLTAERGVR